MTPLHGVIAEVSPPDAPYLPELVDVHLSLLVLL